MKRVVYSTESYNYGQCIIVGRSDGWYVLRQYSEEEIAGPFRSWIDAENFVQENGLYE